MNDKAKLIQVLTEEYKKDILEALNGESNEIPIGTPTMIVVNKSAKTYVINYGLAEQEEAIIKVMSKLGYQLEKK